MRSALLNNDTIPDLVVINSQAETGTTVSVLIGKSGGGYQPSVDFQTDAYPNGLQLADINNDNHIDIVVSNAYEAMAYQDCSYTYPGNNINILYGNGDGTFQTLKRVGAGTAAASLAVADFDRNGKMDIAYASWGTDTITVTYQNADTSFYGIQSFPSCAVESYSTIADFNNDGNPDIATTSQSNGLAGIFLGTGDGNVTGPTTLSIPGNIFQLVHGDFNGDGNMDLAIAGVSDPCINILTGAGDGTFTQTTYWYSQKGTDVYENFFTGDVNGDGLDDFFTATPPYINVLLASKISPPFVTSTLSSPSGVIDCRAGKIADLNNDGLADVVIACDGGLVTMMGDGTGVNFQFSLNTDLGGSGGIDTSDLNGDGYVDVLSAGDYSGDVQYFLNDGTGKLVLAATLQASNVFALDNAVRIIDLDGDGHADLVVNSRYGSGANIGGPIYTWLGHGDGTFTGPTTYLGGYTHTFEVGDLNHDGRVDLIIPAQDVGLQVFVNRGCVP
jgi:hypothetical protein